MNLMESPYLKSILPSFHPSIRASMHPFIHPSVHSFVHQSIHTETSSIHTETSSVVQIQMYIMYIIIYIYTYWYYVCIHGTTCFYVTTQLRIGSEKERFRDRVDLGWHFSTWTFCHTWRCWQTNYFYRAENRKAAMYCALKNNIATENEYLIEDLPI